MATASCESCGSTEPLTEVRRVYVTPPAWDTEGRVEAQPGTEWWCVPCCTMYPHIEPGDELEAD